MALVLATVGLLAVKDDASEVDDGGVAASTEDVDVLLVETDGATAGIRDARQRATGVAEADGEVVVENSLGAARTQRLHLRRPLTDEGGARVDEVAGLT